MAANKSQWRTTIIISSSLQNHETCRMLSTQQHRVRFSDCIEAGSFIYPLSGTAFLLVEPQDLGASEQPRLIEHIKKFVQVHRNCFLLLYAPFNGEKELQTLALIQSRFFGSNLKILPVRNVAELVKGMLTVAKATSKPHVDGIRQRMSLVRAHIIENSGVLEMLRGIF
ncbi:uncharacterized protein C1orf146 homolog isoform X1 [Kryptolebias marmoratus]|uniref:Chromosome 1 open reading frame 146 n=1 Tax=Kryptolebias marmoratus TaxID=37003 RepID=A0A3Q2ZN77_KRYMA|nr:uncharacterized protein C1orf146 homolog isoform X1 [Kryptolebias marmoratus]XP_017289208.1 uncharacterized protein C1orf146 homolog isoform X1 [Kryptolebias marmoratus]